MRNATLIEHMIYTPNEQVHEALLKTEQEKRKEDNNPFCLSYWGTGLIAYPAVRPKAASPKNAPKYLRNSRVQAICIAICLSRI